MTPQRLMRFVAGILERLHIPPEDAQVIASALVRADLEGVETHGLARLPNYIERLRKGLINPVPDVKVIRERGATALLDGDNGMGQVTAARAMTEAMRRARAQGIGWVGVTRSNHFGAASYYCQMAVDQGMIGIAFSNAPPGMAPWGGRAPFLGTNPVGFGFPAGSKPPVIIDFATSVASRGQVRKAARTGQPIPSGWAVDAHGNPTEDPQAALKGALLPMGGAKGYGLALAVEILVAVLTGAGVGPEVPPYFDNWEEQSNVGHALVAIDIESFMPAGLFVRRMEALVEGLKSVPPAAGFDGVFLPGERRAARVLQRSGEGINSPVIAQLESLAAELGAPGLKP